MQSFNFTIYGHRGTTWNADAYEPSEGSAFVVHRSKSGDQWLVTHRGTSWIAYEPKQNTRTAALKIAEHLSASCPSASKVTLSEGDATKLVGPHQKMRDEIVAAVTAIGEPSPRRAA